MRQGVTIRRLEANGCAGAAKLARCWHFRARLFAAWLLLLMLVPAAQAHLMTAQRGTLNLVSAGGFVVMSVSVQAFQGVDDDADGRLSMTELRAHAGDISTQVGRELQLIGEHGPIELQGLMLNLAPDTHSPTAPASHLVVMGRFPLVLGGSAGNRSTLGLPPLTLRFSLFGHTADAQRQTVLVRHGSQIQKIEMTPDRQVVELMRGPWQVLRDYVDMGVEHMLGGLDHLLFLLVVLASDWRWRAVVLALATFTIGHAISLMAVTFADLSAPPIIVEPAIAATIVGMALYDRWSAKRSQPVATGWRLGVIFICALIHGLGLANALNSLGLDSSTRVLSLVGFNLGIEAAQLLVALAAGVVIVVVRCLGAPGWIPAAGRLTSYFAIMMMSGWLVQRAIWA
ncbi:MAG: HupE/UreJ family protein [Burkholderiaceae bacterium]